MDKELIQRVLEKLNHNISKESRFVKFSGEGYKPFLLSKQNFHEIKDCSGRIAFIDGGNCEILSSNNFYLGFVRLYYTVYDKVRVKNKRKEFFILVNAENKEGKIVYKTEVFGADYKFLDVSEDDENLSFGKNKVEIGKIVNLVRRFSEIQSAKELVDELSSGDVIVLDGNLEAKYTDEEEVLEGLYQKAFSKGVIVSGLSKTCSLVTDSGDNTLNVVRKISSIGKWLYNPIVEIENKKHQAEISFVKLHEKSKYLFRLDVYKKQRESLTKVCGLLSKNSTDPVFLGYPYGLIEADRFGRVTEREREFLKTKIKVKAGINWEEIADNLKSLDAHGVLDRVG